MSMAATLVSVGNDEGDDADRLRNACVATLCELGNLVINKSFFPVLLLIRWKQKLYLVILSIHL